MTTVDSEAGLVDPVATHLALLVMVVVGVPVWVEEVLVGLLFMAAVVVPDSTLFPLLCIVMLPAWLLLAGKPMMMAWRNDK